MMQVKQKASGHEGTRGRTAFTLIELVVVIGIIAVLLGITVFAVAAMAKDSRQSGAVNSVQASLERCRALAMKRGKPVLVAFFPHVDGEYEHLDILFAEYSGQSYLNDTIFPAIVIDRFIPVTGFEAQELPRGMKVAAPWYSVGTELSDEVWIAASTFSAINSNNEVPGAVIAVMFDRDGSMITRNSRTDSHRVFVDVDQDGFQLENGTPHNNRTSFPSDQFYAQLVVEDEPYLNFAPFLAVYDDAEAREFSDPTGWNNASTKDAELTAYIDEHADRLHFNRYTGVVMR